MTYCYTVNTQAASSRRAGLAVFLALSNFGALSCKSLPKQSEVKEAATSGAPRQGLDVNDVSMLMPFPIESSAIGTMIGLDFVRADGTPLVSKALFTDILRHFKYTATIDGDKVNFNSGSSFKGEQRNGFLNGGPFDGYGQWKVVAMRYDPCAPVDGQKIAAGAQRSLPTAFDANLCSPQLRLTVQPIVSRNNSGFVIRASDNNWQADFPVAGDYALHLIFNLDANDSKSMYQDLVAFRDSCHDVTSGFPLTVQPCLVAERNAGQAGGTHFQAVTALIRRYTKTIGGLAAMASRDGSDPWTFMNGHVEGDTFVHTPIDAVAKDKDIKRNAKGQMIESFHNGYFQQVDFMSVTTRQEDGTVASSTNPDGNRVTPHAVDGKVATSLLAEFNGNLGEVPAFLTKVNRLQNPLLNHFLTTDCASCHGASDVKYRFIDEPNSDFSSRIDNENRSGGPIMANNGLAQAASIGQDSVQAPDFYREVAYTNVVDGHSLASSAGANSGNKPYGFIHFGYFGASGSVSQRSANESALAAKLANQYYGEGAAPKASCDVEPLRSCLGEPLLRFWADRKQGFSVEAFLNLQLYPIEWCMQRVCANRAAELKDVFGPHHVKKLVVKEDVDIYLALPGALKLAQGTKVEGLFLRDNRGNLSFTSPTLIPLKAQDGSTHYAVRSILSNYDLTSVMEEQ